MHLRSSAPHGPTTSAKGAVHAIWSAKCFHCCKLLYKVHVHEICCGSASPIVLQSAGYKQGSASMAKRCKMRKSTLSLNCSMIAFKRRCSHHNLAPRLPWHVAW